MILVEIGGYHSVYGDCFKEYLHSLYGINIDVSYDSNDTNYNLSTRFILIL